MMEEVASEGPMSGGGGNEEDEDSFDEDRFSPPAERWAPIGASAPPSTITPTKQPKYEALLATRTLAVQA